MSAAECVVRDIAGLARPVGPVLSLLAGCCLMGCGPADPDSKRPASTVRDSAGIEIVDVSRDAWEEGEGWAIDPRPTLKIGALEGQEPYLLSDVRSAARLSDGRVVVVNAATHELRFFDAAGRWLRTAGGKGEGPGEFTSLFGAVVRADTVYAHDMLGGRVNVYDASGRFVRTVLLARDEGRPYGIWPVADGYIGLWSEFPDEISEEFTYSRRISRFRRYTASGALGARSAALPGQETVMRGRLVGTGLLSVSGPPLVSHSSQQTVVDDRLVAGITDRFEIRVYGKDFALVRLIRDSTRTMPLTEEEWNAVVQERLARAELPSQRRAALEFAEVKPPPETRPSFDRFVADSEGYVWMAPYRPPKGVPVPWLVVDPRGSVLGTVDLPEGFQLTDVGLDYVIGITSDELDVQYVFAYSLVRQRAGPGRIGSGRGQRRGDRGLP